jgi:hypothetical protein
LNDLVHLLLSETTLSPHPLQIAEISPLGIEVTFLEDSILPKYKVADNKLTFSN